MLYFDLFSASMLRCCFYSCAAT